MNYVLTQEKAKRQAKQLAEYLKSLGTKISYGNALEAVALMHDTKSWNHLSACLNEQPAATALPDQEPGELYYVVSRQRPSDSELIEYPVRAIVFGEVYSSDHVEYDSFEAASWLMTAPEETILALAKNDWELEYTQETLGLGNRIWGEHAEVVHAYVRDHNATQDSDYWVTMVVDLPAAPVMSFLRAFRYSLFVKIALDITFANEKVAEEVAFYGYNREHYHVESRDVQTEQGVCTRWVYIFQVHEVTGHFDTEESAWIALGKKLENRGILAWNDEYLEPAKQITPESGFVGK